MNVPKDVRHAFAGLHQDILLEARSYDDLVDSVVIMLSNDTRPVVRSFLEGLLDGTRTRGEIRAAFDKTESEIRFDKDEELIAFLHRLKSRLQN